MNIFTLCTLLLLGLQGGWTNAAAQTPDAQPSLGFPMVTFEMNWRNVPPRWYSVSMDSTGRAGYQSEPGILPGEDASDPYIVKFTSTQATRAEIFRLARELDYFRQGNYEYKNVGGALQGPAQTLRWGDTVPNEAGLLPDRRDIQATYTSSTDPRVNELTSIFERISATMEEGRRLSDSLSSNPAAVPDELSRMQDRQNRHELLELQALQPQLQSIAEDPAMAETARQRARELLGMAKEFAGR
jgi:hypothetical protein